MWLSVGMKENTEQSLRIVFPLRLLHRPLKFQKRGALHKKYRKRTQPCVCHRIVRVFSGSPIGESFESCTQLLDHIAKGQGIYSKGGAHKHIS